jgi:uncharacterized membrane protein YebE (DUF533 family)
MSLQNLLNQFIGSSGAESSSGNTPQNIGETFNKLSSNMPGGLVGGAAAGGIMALLMGNKSARKFAGKAATYGGAALLGGLAYKAVQNWQQNSSDQTGADTGLNMPTAPDERAFVSNEVMQPAFEMTLIKAMIAAAKADGHIDTDERQRIFKAVEEMSLSNEMKGMVFDLLQQQISVEELVRGVSKVEQKSELYLASCLAINPDHPSEKVHLDQLAAALELPQGLAHELQWQAQKAISEAA